MATTALWRWMRAKMLPSPSKFHYTFNMRELSRVFQVHTASLHRSKWVKLVDDGRSVCLAERESSGANQRLVCDCSRTTTHAMAS